MNQACVMYDVLLSYMASISGNLWQFVLMHLKTWPFLQGQ
jgi:hypothetical protein